MTTQEKLQDRNVPNGIKSIPFIKQETWFWNPENDLKF